MGLCMSTCMSEHMSTWRAKRNLSALPISQCAPHKWDNYRTIARVVKVYDGDTITVVFPFRFGAKEYMTTNIRILGIDTAEMHPSRAKSVFEREVEIKYAKLARIRLCELIGFDETITSATDIMPDAQPVFVNLVLVKADKYGGRIVGEVFTSNGVNVAETLIAEHLAVEYDGGKKNDVIETLRQYN